MNYRLKFFSAGLIGAALLAVVKLPLQAQPAPGGSEPRVNISPAALAEIREAPFSEIFDIGDGEAFAVKDQDYRASEPDIGVFTLWADVPELDRLGLVVKYCLEDTSIANANAELVEVTLSDSGRELVAIDDLVESRPAYLNQVRAPRQSNVSTSFYYNPFYDPFYYSPFRVGLSYSPPTYIPGVDCSTGLAFFDLQPVQAEIAALPEKTLQARLLFSNGMTHNWQLGGGTVGQLKKLPSLIP